MNGEGIIAFLSPGSWGDQTKFLLECKLPEDTDFVSLMTTPYLTRLVSLTNSMWKELG